MNTKLPGSHIELHLPAGYTARSMSLEDVPAVTAMLNADSRALLGTEKFDEQDVSSDWGWGGADLENNSRVLFAPDGALVGYEGFWTEEAPQGNFHLWGRVHPAHLGRGLASYLLEWVEWRAQDYLHLVPSGKRAVLVSSVPEISPAAKQVLLDHGYQVVRHYLRMVTAFSEPPAPPAWPAGIQVRTYQVGPDDLPTMRLMREAFRDHWGHTEVDEATALEGWRKMRLEDPEFDPSLYFLAMDGEQIVGASLCIGRTNDDQEMGYVQTLGVLRPWRQRGLGEALLRHSFQEFYRRGRVRAGLTVDAENLTNAVRLYEKAGMHSDPQRLITRLEKEIVSGEKGA
ncbi:MAG: GNAT family N-acetyltransferase [Anaerolineales bacterium]|nr:GNAT family N-acetyltransferase [Anaerolineales bacterium]